MGQSEADYPSLSNATHHCPSLPITAHCCPALSNAAQHCLMLPTTAHHCQMLPITAHHSPILPITAHRCPPLPITAQCCPSQPITAHHCPSLPTIAPSSHLLTCVTSITVLWSLSPLVNSSLTNREVGVGSHIRKSGWEAKEGSRVKEPHRANCIRTSSGITYEARW